MGKTYKHLSRKRDQLHVKKLQLATPVCGILNGTVGKAIWFQATLAYLKTVLPAKYFNFQPTCVNNRINKGNELTEQFLLNCFYKNRTSMHQNFEFVVFSLRGHAKYNGQKGNGFVL